MKKQNLSSLVLRKNKISNLNRLSNLVGGTNTASLPTEEVPSGVETVVTNCGTCTECISHRPNECGTNDTIRSLGNPTVFATGSGVGSELDC